MVELASLGPPNPQHRDTTTLWWAMPTLSRLTLDLIRAMAEKKAERVVCLDEGFAGNDQLNANAVQIFKTKGVTSFKTV